MPLLTYFSLSGLNSSEVHPYNRWKYENEKVHLNFIRKRVTVLDCLIKLEVHRFYIGGLDCAAVKRDEQKFITYSSEDAFCAEFD